MADEASCTMGTSSIPGCKAAGPWLYHQLISSTEVKGRIYTCTRPVGLHGLLWSEVNLTFYIINARKEVGFLEIVLSWIVID